MAFELDSTLTIHMEEKNMKTTEHYQNASQMVSWQHIRLRAMKTVAHPCLAREKVDGYSYLGK